MILISKKDDKQLDEVREFVPRHEAKKSIEMANSQRQLRGRFNSNSILAKLSQNIDEFSKVNNKKYEVFDDLGEEFEVRWYALLEEHDMDYLPPNMPLYAGSKSILYQDMMSLIEEMMSRAGARKDETKNEDIEEFPLTSGGIKR